MLTYSDLKKTYHTEKKTSSLTRINNNFYSDAQELLAQIGDLHRSHLTEILSEIYELRKNKIILNAARSNKPENLIPAESELYDGIINKLETFRNDLLSGLAGIKRKEEPEGEDKKEAAKKEEVKKGDKKEAAKKEEVKRGDKKEAAKKEEVKRGDKKEADKPAETEKIKIRAIKNIPAIIGSDLVHYEFKEGDESVMPKIDAKILIENGLAIRI